MLKSLNMVLFCFPVVSPVEIIAVFKLKKSQIDTIAKLTKIPNFPFLKDFIHFFSKILEVLVD